MIANLCFVTCALVAVQSPDRSEWLMMPRLSRGQELVYRGSVAEEALGSGVQFKRSYQLESRVFVLDVPVHGFDVALYTVLKRRGPRSERGLQPEPSSVRLELARIDHRGRIRADPSTALSVPLEGPATIECGAFLELPRVRVGMNQPWETSEDGRPPRIWKIVGTEIIDGTSCLKLYGLQQSSDWDQPRADHTAWRRIDTLWVSPKLGVAYKVERTIERREPARREPTHRSIAQYELESNIQYPGQLFEDRRREILQARTFTEVLTPLLVDPAKQGTKPFDGIVVKVNYFLENQAPTPYREAVLQVKRRAESAKRGEPVPVIVPDDTSDPVTTVTLGHKAPDFVVTNLLTRESVHLRRWLGRPVLMVFYNPTSVTVEPLLRFAQALQDQHNGVLTVLAFALSEDVERIQKQHAELRLSMPVLSGKGLRQSYAVDATPKLIVLDAEEVVRGNYVGWGPETSRVVTEEVKLWLHHGKSATSREGGKGGGGSAAQR